MTEHSKFNEYGTFPTPNDVLEKLFEAARLAEKYADEMDMVEVRAFHSSLLGTLDCSLIGYILRRASKMFKEKRDKGGAKG